MELARKRQCRLCGCETEQTLRPCPEGAVWMCRSGNHEAQRYSHEDMQSLLGHIASKLPKRENKPLPSLEGVKVFLEHHTGEQELAPEFVRTHVEITGELPKVGGSMFARTKGIPEPFNAVPYGKVIRIECTQPST